MRQLPALPSWTVSSHGPCKVTLSSPSVVLETSLRQRGQLHGNNQRLTSVFPDESPSDGHLPHPPQISHPEEGNSCPQAPFSLMPAELMTHASLPIFRSFPFKASLGTCLPHSAPKEGRASRHQVCLRVAWCPLQCDQTAGTEAAAWPQGVSQLSLAAMTVTLPHSATAGQVCLSRHQAKVPGLRRVSQSPRESTPCSCQLWCQAPFLLYFPQCTEQSQGGHSSTHFPPP